ncbi:CHAT domain-containing protein [Suillus ampliporus]|nr:CHAT domain-containing protein [Suillus ampliporus]
MPGSLEGQYIRLEVISGKNLKVRSWRIPAGIYVSINVDPRRRWKSAVRVLSSDESVAWGDAVTLSTDASPKLSLEIRASFELGRMLGQGELIGEIEMSWNELLDHGDEPFVLSFQPIRRVCPSLTLKASSVHPCGDDDGGLFDLQSIIDCEIPRHTDAGHAIFAEYVTSKSVSHLNNAMEHFQLVLDQCPISHPDHAAALTNLAWARLEGYLRKDLQDIDSTTSLFRDALALRPPLISRYTKECTVADIHESAQLCSKLLPLCPEGTYFRSIDVDSVVNFVMRECLVLQDASNEGIQVLRVVLELCPFDHQCRPHALGQLAQAVETLFHQRGSIDDLEESIQLGREAVSLCPDGHPSRVVYLHNLAFSLGFRFDHQGKSHDLDESISLHEEALSLCPVGHESRDKLLNNLGGALLDRFNQHRGIDDINRAINLRREALKLNPPGLPNRDTILSDLASALKTRYDKSHVSEDLNEAIELYRESLRLRQHDHPRRHVTLFNLSGALCSLFTETQNNEDVEEAIGLCHESLVVLPPLHPERFFSYMHLQEAYLSRYQIQDNPTNLSLAVENFRLASKHPTQGFPERVKEAINWTLAAEKHSHSSALEAYKTYFELLDKHLSTRSSIVARREATAAFRRASAAALPVDAASCAIRRGNLREAIELLEQGRGQQWSMASRLRTPLEDLESTNPELAHRFSQLSQRLSDAQGSVVSADGAAADQAAMEYRKLTTEWEATVAEIRNHHDFSRFLLPPLYEDLQAAASHGPIIILIASKYSCNALIVPTSGEPHHVPFSSLTLSDLKKLKEDFASEIRHATLMGPTEPRKDLRVLLRKIWDGIMLPIVNVLKHDLKLRRRSRIWLCPTAAFTSIPLHAAHPFRTKADRSGREKCLEDIYICSYTPTLSALIRSRQMMKTSVAPSFVAIGQSQPGAGQGTVLATVDSELELVHKLVPPNVKFTCVSDSEATQAGALEALRRNTWVHLACHGKQDRQQPYNSRFAMRDKPLTLLDIMENNAPQAEFVFLSACHTAVGDEETPDEVIHLAAGLQFSGFKSVIGTLWVVDDAVAKHVVEAFYEKMFKDVQEGVIDCTKAASALNHATCSVMNKVPLEQRMVFVHIGV